jgi:hypothetical protein
LQALAVVLPLVVAWLLWSRLGGPIGIKSAGAAALYFMGVGLGVLGVIDSNRRRFLAASVVLLIYGVTMPSLTLEQMCLGGGLGLVAYGLLSAGITVFQLKSDGDFDKGELA